MKITSTNLSTPKIFHIDSLKGGLNFSENSHNGLTGFSACENVWRKDGVIKTRPSIVGDINSVFNDSFYRPLYDSTFYALDNEVCVSGAIKKIVMEHIRCDESSYTVLTYFINADFSVWKTAKMEFYRSSDEDFFIPKNVLIFEGEPQNGCGLFAVASLVNCEDISRKITEIYELNSNYTQWQKTNNIYTPTVYINGRGNKYEEAQVTGQAFKGTPQRLEQLNILDGRFYAYFSTDGRSSSFRLPFSELDNKTVACRLYYSVSQYIEWLIPESSTTATATLYNVQVTMTVNREKGIVAFSVPAGEYEMPLISDRNENNLRISAYKTRQTNFITKKECGAILQTQGKIFLSSGAELYIADYRKPLYFPVGGGMVVGDDSTPITALSGFGKGVVAFKENGVYRIELKRGSALNSISLLADSDAVFYTADSCISFTICLNVGASYQSAVLAGDDSVYFKGSNGRLYKISSSFDISPISEKINSFISPLDDRAFGWRYEEYFIFTIGSALLLYNPEENGEWYYWSLPQNAVFSGALTIGGVTRILLRNPKTSVGYFADLLGGAEDCVLTGAYTVLTEVKAPVKALIRTNKNSLGCSHIQKSVSEIDLELRGKKIHISVNGKPLTFISSAQRGAEYDYIRLYPTLTGVNFVDLTLESNETLGIGSVDIKYLPLEL